MFNITRVKKITGGKTGRMSHEFDVMEDYGAGKTVTVTFLQNKGGGISEVCRRYSLDWRLDQECEPGFVVEVDDLIETFQAWGYDADYYTVYDSATSALVRIFVNDNWNKERRDIFVEYNDVGSWIVAAIACRPFAAYNKASDLVEKARTV